MIKTIEALRIEQKISKTELANSANVSKAMYYKYLNGSSIPVEVFKRFLNYLGYDLMITKRNSSMKL